MVGPWGEEGEGICLGEEGDSFPAEEGVDSRLEGEEDEEEEVAAAAAAAAAVEEVFVERLLAVAAVEEEGEVEPLAVWELLEVEEAGREILPRPGCS